LHNPFAMRRLLAIVLAAAPLVTIAQTAGGIIASPTFINHAQCLAADTTSTISLTWTIQLDTGVTFSGTGGAYRVYAASKDQGTLSPFCHRANDTATPPTYKAGQLVTKPDPPIATFMTSSATVKTSDITAKAGFGTCDADQDAIQLCVLWYDIASPTTNSTPKGWAKGSVALKVVPPFAPTVTSVVPGEKALNVAISVPSTGVEATTFRARAVATADPGEHLSAETAIGSKVRIGGLVNGVGYVVTAFTYSADGNQSLDSLPWGAQPDGTPVAPRPVEDDWEYYKDVADGRDDGGCDAGPAGLLALLGAAALLRLRRRS
jgi:hypothetical protein